MTKNEAIDEVKHLAGLFPTMTTEQGVFWRDHFMNYDVAVVRKAIDRHHLCHQFIDSENLSDMIVEELRKSDDRREQEAARKRDEQDRIRRQEEAVEQIIGGMSDDELQDRRRQLIEERPHLKPFIESRNPRTSITVKCLIAEKFVGVEK